MTTDSCPLEITVKNVYVRPRAISKFPVSIDMRSRNGLDGMKKLFASQSPSDGADAAADCPQHENLDESKKKEVGGDTDEQSQDAEVQQAECTAPSESGTLLNDTPIEEDKGIILNKPIEPKKL